MTQLSTQRSTKQRQVILDVLQHTKSHPTADEVYQLVRKKIPKISLGTIYRNLEKLSASGTITKIENAGAQNRYDGDAKTHYHARCCDCGKITDVELSPIKEIDQRGREIEQFHITDHKLEFIGLCYHCHKTN